jgi:hypothetical protein
MLRLRSLLSRLHAVPQDVERNRELIGEMFDHAGSERRSSSSSSSRAPELASPLSPSFRLTASASIATSTCIRQQQSVHSCLTRLSELYTRGDARTVRMDVGQLDGLYDLADDACASFLFNLRPSASLESTQPRSENDDEDEKEQPEGEKEATADSDVMEPRRLLLRAVAHNATTAELQYLYSILPSQRQKDWRQVHTW